MLRRLLYVFGLLIASGLFLYFVLDMRVEFTGNMQYRRITWGSERRRVDAAIEASRASQALVSQPLANQLSVSADPAAVPSPAVLDSKLAAVIVPVSNPVSHWTDFRGPHRDGVYSEAPIATEWPAQGLPRLWKQPIGAGFASFSFGEGRAYTIEQRRDKEAVTAYDPTTGRELWAFTYPASFDETLGGPGPRATPVYHTGLVYSLGAEGDLYCLYAATGKPKWSKNILNDNGTKNIHWAMSGAPLIVGNMVMVTPGGADGHSVAAYDLQTGAQVWHSLNDAAGYTSPILADLAGRKQIVWISADRVVGIAPEDGRQLWEYPFPSQMGMNCSQPVAVDPNHVLVSSAQGPGAALLEINKNGDSLSVREVWKNNRFKNKFNSSVIRDGYAYGFDEAILACIDLKTGELKWKGGRYGYGQLLLAGDHLVITTEEGEVVLVKASPDAHHEVARFPAIEGRTWNIPAIDHGLLLVRNSSEMACFRIGRNL